MLLLISLRHTATADQTTTELDDLFSQLQQLNHREEVKAAFLTQQIWWHWADHQNTLAKTALQLAIKFTETGQYHLALSALDRAIKMEPTFAEAWNKRAIVHFMRGDYQNSRIRA